MRIAPLMRSFSYLLSSWLLLCLCSPSPFLAVSRKECVGRAVKH